MSCLSSLSVFPKSVCLPFVSLFVLQWYVFILTSSVCFLCPSTRLKISSGIFLFLYISTRIATPAWNKSSCCRQNVKIRLLQLPEINVSIVLSSACAPGGASVFNQPFLGHFLHAEQVLCASVTGTWNLLTMTAAFRVSELDSLSDCLPYFFFHTVVCMNMMELFGITISDSSWRKENAWIASRQPCEDDDDDDYHDVWLNVVRCRAARQPCK